MNAWQPRGTDMLFRVAYATSYTRALMRIPRSHVARPGFLISANDGALVTVKGEARILSGGVMRNEKRAAERLSLQFDRRMETRSDLDAQQHPRKRVTYVAPFTRV